MATELGFPHGHFELFADDDDVIGLTVAKTYPHGWPIVRIDPPIMDAFDEFEVGQFLARCLSNSSIEYVQRGCLNLRWNDDGSLSCIHDDSTPCDLPNHTTVPMFVRTMDLVKPDA